MLTELNLFAALPIKLLTAGGMFGLGSLFYGSQGVTGGSPKLLVQMGLLLFA